MMYEKLATAYRGIGLAILYFVWMYTSHDIVDLIFILVLLVLAMLRWRFPNLKYTLILDQYVVIVASGSWDCSRYALALVIFEAAYLGKLFLAAPAILYITNHISDTFMLLLVIQGLFTGVTLYLWRNQYELSLRRIDSERSQHYRTESMNQELITVNSQIARMAELSERSRIAREIHDNAGHEIVAAYISLQTVRALQQESDSDINELFDESMIRLESGIDKIREAIHNIAPITEIGVLILEKLCDKFTHCSIQFTVYGDSSKVSVHLWTVLEVCLKESLTNVMRHANAKNVTVTLDVTPYIVRLCVENDGVNKSTNITGLGIYSLRNRAKAVGGNVSTDSSDCFRLVCVLPIQKGETI